MDIKKEREGKKRNLKSEIVEVKSIMHLLAETKRMIDVENQRRQKRRMMNGNESYLYEQARKDGCCGAQEAARKIGISFVRLRYWRRLGIVKTHRVWRGRRKLYAYTEEDIKNATLVKLFMDTGRYTIKRAIQKLRELG